MKKYEYDLTIPHDILCLTGLTCLEKMVLSLVHHLDDNGCTAGNEFLQDRLSITAKQLKGALRNLESKGMIKRLIEMGQGILGKNRKLLSQIVVRTMVPKGPMVSIDHGTKRAHGMVPKGPMVLEGLSGLPISVSTEIPSDSLNTVSNIYTIENSEIHGKPFQPVPKVGSDLLEKLKDEVKKKGLCLGFGDEQLATLSAFDEQSLVICMRLAAEGCKGNRISFNYFAKIVDTNGHAKRVLISVAQEKPVRKLFKI